MKNAPSDHVNHLGSVGKRDSRTRTTYHFILNLLYSPKSEVRTRVKKVIILNYDVNSVAEVF
jgi:hypothetical protein